MTTEYPAAPGYRTTETETSANAAKTVRTSAESIRQDCLAALTKESLTAHEVAARTRSEEMDDVQFVRYQHSVQSRISELKAQGKVAATALRRENPESGQKVVVWAKTGKLMQPNLI